MSFGNEETAKARRKREEMQPRRRGGRGGKLAEKTTLELLRVCSPRTPRLRGCISLSSCLPSRLCASAASSPPQHFLAIALDEVERCCIFLCSIEPLVERE